jgi:uncharacterized membrane protein YkvA (DUF1232 family)
LFLFQAFKKGGLFSKFPKILTMYKAYRKGEFQMDLKNVIIPLAAFVYIISPLDILPGIFLDDLAILALVMPMILKEVDRFIIWEKESTTTTAKNNHKVIDAEIVE